MADKKLEVTIKGAEDIFKDMDKSVKALAKSIDSLSKKQETLRKRTEESRKKKKEETDQEKKKKKQDEATIKTGKILGTIFSGNIKAIGGLASGLAKAVPQIAAVQAVASGLWEGLKKLYTMTLAQNRIVLETGDAFAYLDLSTGDVGTAVQKLRDDLEKATVTSGVFTSTVGDQLEAMKGYQEAGMIVDSTSSKFENLYEATSMAINFGTLFQMKYGEMAKTITDFTRELNISGEMGKEAFTEIFESSLKSRYGTRNFLMTVQQVIPTMGYFGGSIGEASRLLEFMGKTSTISMRQAKESINALTVGIKELNVERRIEIAALVGQENMVKIIQGTIERLRGEMSKLEEGSADYLQKEMELAESIRDRQAVMAGEFIAAGRAMKRVGAAGHLEMILTLPEKFIGKQLKSLEDIANLDATQEYLTLKGLGLANVTEKHLEVIKHMAVLARKENIKSTDDFIKFLRKNPEEIEKRLNPDKEKERAEKFRKLIQDRVGNVLENILFALMNEIAPYVQMGLDLMFDFAERYLPYMSETAAEIKATRILMNKARQEYERGERKTLDQTAYLKELKDLGAVNHKALLEEAGILKEIESGRKTGRTAAWAAGAALAPGVMPWLDQIAEKLFPSISGAGKRAPFEGFQSPWASGMTLNQNIYTNDSKEAGEAAVRGLQRAEKLAKGRAD